MTPSGTAERPTLTLVSFGRSTDNVLWERLASSVSGSAAGSRLAGFSGPGQPISLPANVVALRPGMFDYGPEHARPLDGPEPPDAA